MPKFVFPLQAVLRHREHVERERQRELALGQAEMSRLRDELKALNDSLQASSVEMKDHHLTGSLDVNYLAAHRRYTVAMQRRGLALVRDMARQQKKVDEAQRLLAEAAKERKTIEKLRERQHERWAADVARREAAQLDEVGMQMTYRQHLAGADNDCLGLTGTGPTGPGLAGEEPSA
jgi:flagellar FliJ protein